MPCALCPVPFALCPMPCALCPMLSALHALPCSFPSGFTEAFVQQLCNSRIKIVLLVIVIASYLNGMLPAADPCKIMIGMW